MLHLASKCMRAFAFHSGLIHPEQITGGNRDKDNPQKIHLCTPWVQRSILTSQSPLPLLSSPQGLPKGEGDTVHSGQCGGMGTEKNKGVGPPSPPELPRGGTVQRGKGPGEKMHPQGHPPITQPFCPGPSSACRLPTPPTMLMRSRP